MIRTGIDRGFDGGAAAWALDLPGCVATDDSERDAVQMLPARVGTFLEWLAAAGERAEAPRTSSVQVVERFDSYRLEDGYEVNATFEADREPVTREEATSALRWLDVAHRRLAAAIAVAGAAPLSGEGRTRDELMAHVVRAERWLATRVEPDQRQIVFPREDVPVDVQLKENRAFVRAHVLRASEGDGVRARVDSKGEGWTTRKVVRRLIYHVLDHAEELERRSGAEAGRRVEAR